MSQNPRSFGASLRRAWASLTRRPGYFVIAVSSLAIALGLATTVIAQIDTLMHPYTPLRDADGLYHMYLFGAGKASSPSTVDAMDALRASGLFSDVGATVYGMAPLEIGRGVENTDVAFVSRAYQDMVGMTPRLGRQFSATETSESNVAIVSDAFWRRYFGNAATLDNATFAAADRVYHVIGVLEPGWNPLGAVWFGQNRSVENSTARALRQLVVRYKPGTADRSVDTVLRSIADRWTAQFGNGGRAFYFSRRSMRPDPLQVGSFHRAMIAAAFFIILIASANVSALMLARSVTNRRNQALRLALGAERRDLLRDVVAEVVLVTAAGGVAGVAIAYGAMGILVALTPVELSWLGFARPNLNLRVLVGLFGVVTLAVSIAALGPALYAARIAPAEPLKENSGTTTGRMGSRFRLLIVGELALAMILLFGASLISKTAHRVTTYDFGYEARHLTEVSTMVHAVQKLSPPVPAESAQRVRRWPEILANDLDAITARLRDLPEVRGAAWFAHDQPDNGVVMSDATAIYDSSIYRPQLYNVGPGFLGALGVALFDGRDFVDGDRQAGAAILDDRAARRLFPHGHAVGSLIKLGPLASKTPWIRVVGVCHPVVHELPEYPEIDPQPVIYVSRNREPGFGVGFVIRGTRNATDIGPIVTRIVRDRLPPRASVGADSWSRRYDAIRAGRTFTAGLFATLSLASLALATAGLFGVLSYAVGQRMPEFSLRVALGAQKPHVLRLVFRESMVMALGGTAIGGLVGLYAGFEVYDWLWGVYPVDAVALVIAEAVLLTVTVMASSLPALRATRANPADVMRAI